MMQAEKVAEDLRDAHEVIAGANSPRAGARRRDPPAGAARGAGAGPGRAGGEGARCGARPRWTKRAAISKRRLRAADFDPAELERIEERLFALRAAGRKYNVPVDELAALAAQYNADIALIDAGEERLKALEAAAREAEAAYRAAADALSKARAQGRRRARQGGQWRAQAAQARAREILDRDRERCRRRRAERHRPGRILGADQSGHAAGAADEGRLRRRAGALPAGAEGGAGRPRLGADVGVRRDRHRRRRRGRRRHRRAARQARVPACRCWR